MKILCIVSRLDRPSTKYRLLQYIPFLQENGIEPDIHIVPDGLKRWKFFAKAGDYDAVFIQKKLFSRMQLWYLKQKAKKIIYDFDDAIMYTKSKYSAGTRRYKRFRYMIKIADLVIAGNRYLAENSDQCKTEIIPTVLDVLKYPLHKRSESGIIIGWIGTKSTQGYLVSIESLFYTLMRKYPRLKIKVISDEMPELSGDVILWEKWEQEKEITALLSFDIGIMPLIDNPWTRGKCGFKIIQYISAGIPVICSPVGMNTEIIKDGVNGFYAENLEEWENAVAKLIGDVHVYKNMSIAARETAEKNYNLFNWGPHFAKLIGDCLK